MNDSTWKALVDPTRRKILALLRINTRLSPTQLTSILGGGITMSALSHSLNILLAADLVVRKRDGTTMFYSINYEHPDGVLFNYLVLEFEKDKKEIAIQRPMETKRITFEDSEKKYMFRCIDCKKIHQLELEQGMTSTKYVENHKCKNCNGTLRAIN